LDRKDHPQQVAQHGKDRSSAEQRVHRVPRDGLHPVGFLFQTRGTR
jgi:hypothetical protein